MKYLDVASGCVALELAVRPPVELYLRSLCERVVQHESALLHHLDELLLAEVLRQPRDVDVRVVHVVQLEPGRTRTPLRLRWIQCCCRE